MAKLLFTRSMARLLVGHDESPLRFESFCVDLFSEVDGVTFVPTPRSHYQGLDGRLASTPAAGPTHVICCSLQRTVLAKAKKEFESRIAHARPRVVRFCFNSDVSQATADKIRKTCVAACPQLRRVEVEDLATIVHHAERYPSVLHRHYRGELADLRDTLSADDDSPGVLFPENVPIG